MKQRSIFVYTHDSIGLGEDGPTHQPVEQMANLRTTPNLASWRPCDQVESAVAWQQAVERADGPSALVFTRQALRSSLVPLSRLQRLSKVVMYYLVMVSLKSSLLQPVLKCNLQLSLRISFVQKVKRYVLCLCLQRTFLMRNLQHTKKAYYQAQ